MLFPTPPLPLKTRKMFFTDEGEVVEEETLLECAAVSKLSIGEVEVFIVSVSQSQIRECKI